MIQFKFSRVWAETRCTTRARVADHRNNFISIAGNIDPDQSVTMTSSRQLATLKWTQASQALVRTDGSPSPAMSSVGRMVSI
jgi:hypothetical protein